MSEDVFGEFNDTEQDFADFAKKVKSSLLVSEPKQRCCRSSLICGVEVFAKRRKNSHTQAVAEFCERLRQEPKRKNKREFVDLIMAADGFVGGKDEGGSVYPDASGGVCAECFSNLLRGCFLSAGRMGDPRKNMYVELSMPNERAADVMQAELIRHGVAPKRTVRRGESLLYYKRTESIEDLLNLMGAHAAYFRISDAIIYKDFNKRTNRSTNCDTSNIKKTVNASARQVSAITAIAAAGMLDALPGGIRDTATVRLENPEVSLEELVALHPYHITRSGVQHRLAKAVKFAEQKGYV